MMKRKGTMAQAFEKARSNQKKEKNEEDATAQPPQVAQVQASAEKDIPDWRNGVKVTPKLERNQDRVLPRNRDRRRHRRRRILREGPSAKGLNKLKSEAAGDKTRSKKQKSNKRRLSRGAKKYNWKTAKSLDNRSLEQTYGGFRSAREKRKQEVSRPQEPYCKIPQPFKRSPLFSFSKDNEDKLLQLTDGQQWESSDRRTDSEMEIVIGLDFGTSSTKVVLQDIAKRSYAVPFTDSTKNPYLLPSRVYEESGEYSLDRGALAHRDIKLRLMERKLDQTAMMHAVAYLSLVICHCRAWLWEAHKDIYLADSITWGLNLGLPAASYEQDWLVERFFVLAMASMEMADSGCSTVSVKEAAKYISWAKGEVTRIKKQGGDLTQSITDEYFVGVFPEIAAQIYGFVQSERWDSKEKPMMMMVDVGAGTVDASIFTVTKAEKGQNRFNFLGNNVEPNGVMNLHRERIHWLESLIRRNDQWTNELGCYFEDIDIPTDRLQPIPESWSEYLPGMVVEMEKNKDVDSEFYNKRYWAQLYLETISQVKNDKDPGSLQWKNLPFFLCGGGRGLSMYEQIITKLSSRSRSSTGLDRVELSKPKGMEAKGLKEAEFHRLSVAYGLSFEDVGICVKSGDIPDMSVSVKNWQDRFVSQDVM